jgi:CheY-like chemotaxis protein
MLTNFGFQVVESDSGQDCLDRINKGEKYDISLADEMMAVMSSTEMMKKL